jgi:hypothetical protein
LSKLFKFKKIKKTVNAAQYSLVQVITEKTCPRRYSGNIVREKRIPSHGYITSSILGALATLGVPESEVMEK